MKFNIDNMQSVNDVAPAPIGGGSRMENDEIRLGVSPKQSAKKAHKHAIGRFVIGAGIIEELRWQKGDHIDVLFNDTHIVLKRKNNARYVLQESPRARGGRWRLTVSLFDTMPLCDITQTIRSMTVKWDYIQDGVVIKVPTEF